jgi:putative membrane protein
MRTPVCLLASLLAITPAFAQSPDAPVPSTQDFVHKAGEGGLFELTTSHLALTQSHNPDVIRFAQRMIKDHGDIGNSLKMTVRASKPALPIPAALEGEHLRQYQDMKGKSDTDFDAAYIDAQTSAHFDAVALFTTYGKGGDDQRLKAFATQTIPMLRAHQDALAHLGAR